MVPQPPPGQGPIDPRAAFPPPGVGAAPPAQAQVQRELRLPAAQAGGQPQASAQPAGAPTPGVSSRMVPNMMSNPTPQGMPPMQPMPQMMPMGPMMPMGFPYPPPPRRSGAGRAIFLGMLVLLLLLSGVLNLVLIGASLGDGGGATQQTVKAGGGSDKIALVPLRGIIDANLSAQFDRFMDMAEADKNVKAVVVEIDSPGGTVTASDEVYNRLKLFKSKKGVPIVVSMGSLATSGGYYAACGADHVFAQPTTFTGNIGVLMPRYNFHKLMEKYGVEETTIVSTGAPFKNAGSSFQPESAEEKQYMQELADSAFSQFKNVVSQGRNSKLKANLEDVANGKVFTAATALNMGLIDQVGYLDDAQAFAQSAAGLTNPTVIRYQDPPSFMDVLLASRSNVGSVLGGAAGEGAGVTVRIDQNLIHELSTPRPLYLWRGQ